MSIALSDTRQTARTDEDSRRQTAGTESHRGTDGSRAVKQNGQNTGGVEALLRAHASLVHELE